jgi:hypothetical protein
MEYLGLHNKPKAEVHPEHLLTGPDDDDDDDDDEEEQEK